MIFRYGSGNEITKTIGTAPGNIRPGTTLKAAIDMVRTALGFTQNVQGHIGSVPQDDSLLLTTEMQNVTVSIQDKAQEKHQS